MTRDAWVDVSAALVTGSAVTTLRQKATVVLETRFADGAPAALPPPASTAIATPAR